MKKILLMIFYSVILIGIVFSETKLSFCDSENDQIWVENVNFKGKIICKDNICFINKTPVDLTFEIYGRKDFSSDQEFICRVTVNRNSSIKKSCSSILKKFNYLYVSCTTCDVVFQKIISEHDDMIFYIENSIEIAGKVTYDENGIPVQKDNLYFVDYSKFKNEKITIRNESGSDIKLYYEKNGKWKNMNTVKNNDTLYIPDYLFSYKERNKGVKYICIEYLGTDNNSYCLTTEKSSYTNSSDIIIGTSKPKLPEPNWQGKSCDELRKQIITNNLPNKNIKFVVQSIATDTPNSAGGIDISIDYWNLSEKTIKYIYFTVEPYNRVGDPTISEINRKSLAVVSVTDFLEQNQYQHATWSNVWYNNTIEYFKIKNIEIIYKDNSKSIIKENEIPSIYEIEPLSCQIFKNEIFSIKYFYDKKEIYCTVDSKSNLEKLNILFETSPKSIRGRYEKNISTSFRDLTANKHTERVIINELLYETKSVTINYKLKGQAEKIIKITDEQTLENIQNFAYANFGAVNTLGLR